MREITISSSLQYVTTLTPFSHLEALNVPTDVGLGLQQVALVEFGQGLRLRGRTRVRGRAE